MSVNCVDVSYCLKRFVKTFVACLSGSDIQQLLRYEH